MLSFLIVVGTIALLEWLSKRMSRRVSAQVDLGLADWAKREADLKNRSAQIDQLRSAALRMVDETAEQATIALRADAVRR